MLSSSFFLVSKSFSVWRTLSAEFLQRGNGKESGALRVLPFENDRKCAGGLHRNLICMLKGGWMSGTSGNHSVCKISERAIVEVLKHFKMLQEK